MNINKVDNLKCKHVLNSVSLSPQQLQLYNTVVESQLNSYSVSSDRALIDLIDLNIGCKDCHYCIYTTEEFDGTVRLICMYDTYDFIPGVNEDISDGLIVYNSEVNRGSDYRDIRGCIDMKLNLLEEDNDPLKGFQLF